jgi:hypothetical protein
MRNRRYSDNNKHFWPFTLAFGCHSSWGFMLDSGAHEDSPGDCHLRIYLGTMTLILELPQLLADRVTRHSAAGSLDAATVARLGRDWYEIHESREFGFRTFEGAIHVHYGAQTNDSRTDRVKVIRMPWRDWRFVRHSHYDFDGKHFHTEFDSARSSWQASTAIREACPRQRFEFDDYDGQRIVATTYIEEREWRLGSGMFRWLSLFRRPKISRCLALDFSSEVGPEKGSWRGATMGHAIEMLPGELHEAAFRRYCEQEHRARGTRYRIKYVGYAANESKVEALSAEGAGG